MAADELALLERVFLRLGSAETDEQLQNVLWKFLPPVLLKLASPHEDVRKKVMELLIHVNKRLKSRSQIHLPVEALLAQYQDPKSTSFVLNFTIIYIKTGFPRLTLEKQAELVPTVLNALENKPLTHLDNLLLLIIPLLGKVEVPSDPSKRSSIFGLNDKPQICRHLLGLMLDVLLLPYGSILQNSSQSGGNPVLSVPPGMSERSYKRIITNNTVKAEELEVIKLGIVKFVSQGVFNDEDVLLHLIVAAADTRFSVTNLGDNELKKVIGSIDWASPTVSAPLFSLYLGSQKSVKPEDKKSPASTRIRLKLLHYLCRVQGNGLTFPASIQVVFDSLYGTNTNARLKSLALNFTTNIVQCANEELLSQVAPVFLSGMQKLIAEGVEAEQGKAFTIIGMIAQKFPKIVYHDATLLESFFKSLDEANVDLKLQIREGLLNLISAYKYDNFLDECDKDGRLNILFALIKFRMHSEESIVRLACIKTLATIFPPDHVPSKFLLLVAIGDKKSDVSAEAFRSLYGMQKKIDMDLSQMNTLVLPSFEQITKFVWNQAEAMKKETTKCYSVGNHILAFEPQTFVEVLIFLRLCLIKNLKIPLTREVFSHPCEYSPIIRTHLKTIFDKEGEQNEYSLLLYLRLVKELMVASPDIVPLKCMIELVGCLPNMVEFIEDKTDWVKEQLSSTREDIRELAAVLFSLILNKQTNDNLESTVNNLIALTSSKTLETQHGAILALGNCLFIKLINKAILGDMYKSCVVILYEFLKNQSALLVGGACTSLGLIGRCCALPLNDGAAKNGSPDAKRSNNITKMDIVEQLLEIMNNSKYSIKIRENAAKSLGLICIGERLIHTREILKGFLETARDTKDVEIHFTVGESLVMCCNSVCSVEARNIWTTLPEDFRRSEEEGLANDNIEWLLDQLLKLVCLPHPNSKQASSIWLLAVLKRCADQEPITKKLQVLQNTFLDLLCENNDIIQDVASKALCLLYDTYKSEDLLAALVKQLTTGTTRAPQVTQDTKLFEEGQLGKSPTGGNLTTYKELCSLASDLNKPDLIYQFMHLANHNAIWNSKKGAAFGFSSIAERCGEDLKAYMSLIVPKLYRYQFDPNHNIQASMHNIWRVLVPEPQKTLDQSYNEILADLLENLNSAQYRVRQSCCLALQDFLKGPGNRSIHDCVDHMDELWSKLFRVMDDHHEATRLIANKTARILSKLCVRGCDQTQGKTGIKMVKAVLPPLLNGMTSPVSEIRLVCLQTIAELVGSAGQQLKPFLPKLIPALLQATSELESSKLSYISTMLGGQSQAQETVDHARASIAKSHFTTETVAKALQYADNSILEELVPKIVDLLKSSMGLATRIACAHFITLLVVQMGQDVQPYTGKLLAALMSGLTDRNSAIRKHYASCIGHLVKTAKESTIEKLLSKLQFWYFEREDDSIRSACALTIQSIGIHNQEVFKNYSSTILPLVFYAMHAEKTPDTEHTLQIWNEIWSENCPGTETGIKQNIESIFEILKTALESPSWTMKAQAANAVTTVANKLGASIDGKHRNAMINILLDGLSGRTWNGKNKLLKALVSICTNCNEGLKENKDVDSALIIETVLRESRKDEIIYKISSLQSLGEILSALGIDRFDEVYSIIQKILTDVKKNEDEHLDTEELAKYQENSIKLKEIAYETLGKTWPSNKDTQKKYREMFVEHCVTCLPLITRSIQVSIVAALYNFVDKLIILDEDGELEVLGKIVDNVLIAIKYALGISKHTRLRKESLNVVLCLANKLKGRHEAEFNKVKQMFSEVLDEISTDNQPEIKSRVIDIKKILY